MQRSNRRTHYLSQFVVSYLGGRDIHRLQLRAQKRNHPSGHPKHDAAAEGQMLQACWAAYGAVAAVPKNAVRKREMRQLGAELAQGAAAHGGFPAAQHSSVSGSSQAKGCCPRWARVGCHAQLCRAQDWEADWVVPGVPQAGIKPKPLPQCACICVSSSGLASPALGLSSCLGWCLCVHMSPKSSMLAKCSIAVGMGNSGFGGQL